MKRRGPKPKKVVLTVKQKEELLKIRRSLKVEKRIALRAEIIILSSEGFGTTQIAKHLHISRPIVITYIKRFKENGLDGLLNHLRPGRPRKQKPQSFRFLIGTD